MKKLLYLLAITILLQSGFCGKRCDDFTTSLIRGPIEDFFGVYKPGNWWVYQNKDGTKRDSIYITDFSDVISRDRTACLEHQIREFTIKNSILMSGNDLYVVYSSETVSVGINFSLIKNQTQSGGFPQFAFDERISKLWSFPEPDNQGNNLLDSIRLNNATYYNILKGSYGNSTYYFAKGKGLIGWIANNETFNLISYKIL